MEAARPVTVVLADPAEVEALWAERERLIADRASAEADVEKWRHRCSDCQEDRERIAAVRDELECEKDAAWTQVSQLTAERDGLRLVLDLVCNYSLRHLPSTHHANMEAILRGES
jgi:hypothetical protein